MLAAVHVDHGISDPIVPPLVVQRSVSAAPPCRGKIAGEIKADIGAAEDGAAKI